MNRFTKGRGVFGQLSVDKDHVPRTARVALSASTGNGAMLRWQNSTGRAVVVTSLVVDITGVATGGTGDFGVGLNSNSSSDTLIDGGSVATEAVLNSAKNAGTNGSMARKVPNGSWVTGTFSGTAGQLGSLAGYAYITYLPDLAG